MPAQDPRWDPEMLAFSAMMEEVATRHPPVTLALPLDASRATTEAMNIPLCAGGPAMAETADRWLPVRGRRIQCRFHRPTPDARAVLVYIHGGGFVWNSIDTHDRLMREYAAAAGCIVVYLVATADRRALDSTVGFGMLAVGVLSPVVYPWYLLGGVLCLIPTARGARRDWLIMLSAVGCLLNPPGFSSGITTALSATAVAVCLAVITPRVLQRRRAERRDTRRDSLSAVG